MAKAECPANFSLEKEEKPYILKKHRYLAKKVVLLRLHGGLHRGRMQLHLYSMP